MSNINPHYPIFPGLQRLHSTASRWIENNPFACALKAIASIPYAIAVGGIACMRMTLRSMTQSMERGRDQAEIDRIGRLLIPLNLSNSERTKVIEAIAAIPSQERESVYVQVKLLIDEHLSSRSLSADDICSIISIVEAIPASQRKVVLLQICDLLGNGSECSQSSVLKEIMRIPVADRVNVIQHACIFHSSPQIEDHNRASIDADIIRAIAAIPAQERDVVAKLARSFKIMGNFSHPAMLLDRMAAQTAELNSIQAIVAIPPVDRENVVRLAQPFRVMENPLRPLTPQERIAAQVAELDIIRAIAAIPPVDRERVVQLAGSCGVMNREVAGWTRADIIRLIPLILAKIPKASFQDVLNMLTLMTPETPKKDKEVIIAGIANLPPERRAVPQPLAFLVSARSQDSEASEWEQAAIIDAMGQPVSSSE
jgi:hypothetical protein